MKTVAELRKDMYDNNRKRFPYIFEEWKWYSYRKFKAKLYMNVSPVLAYLFMKVGISPNAVTVAYIVMGILGGIFLAIPIKWLILAGIILFYFRPFLDWADGLLARATKQTSITGDVLDPYGADSGWVALWAGLGLYLAAKSGEAVFFYLTPIIPVLFALNPVSSAKNRLYDNYIVKGIRGYIASNRIGKPTAANSDVATKHPLISRAFSFFQTLFEHNAGFVDLICLIILLELFLPIFISWLLYLVFLFWQILFFAAGFYTVARGGWVEKELQKKLEQIHKDGPAS